MPIPLLKRYPGYEALVHGLKLMSVDQNAVPVIIVDNVAGQSSVIQTSPTPALPASLRPQVTPPPGNSPAVEWPIHLSYFTATPSASADSALITNPPGQLMTIWAIVTSMRSTATPSPTIEIVVNPYGTILTTGDGGRIWCTNRASFVPLSANVYASYGFVDPRNSDVATALVWSGDSPDNLNEMGGSDQPAIAKTAFPMPLVLGPNGQLSIKVSSLASGNSLKHWIWATVRYF